MPNSWYVKTDEIAEPIGPLSDRELIGLAAAHRISPESLVAIVGEDRWSPAGRVSNLFERARRRSNKPVSTTGEGDGSDGAEVKTQRTLEIAEMNRRITENELQTTELKKDVHAILSSVESQMAVHGKVDELTTSLAGLIGRLSEADAQLRQRDSTITELSAAIENQGTLIQDVLKRLQSQQDTHAILDRVSTEQTRLRQRVDQNANAIELIKQQTSELSEAIDRLSSSIESETEARASANVDLHQELKSIQTEFLLLTTRSADIQAECVALREQFATRDSYAERYLVGPELTRVPHDNETVTGLQPEVDIEFPEANAADADGQEASTAPLDESVDSSLPEDDSAQSMDCPEGIEPATIEIKDLSDDVQLEPEAGPFPISEDLQGSPTNTSQASIDLVAPAFETGSEVEPLEDRTTATVDCDDLSTQPTQTLSGKLDASPTQSPVENSEKANESYTLDIDHELPEANALDLDGLETSPILLNELVYSRHPKEVSVIATDCPDGIEPEQIKIGDRSTESQSESEAGVFSTCKDSLGNPKNTSQISIEFTETLSETRSDDEQFTRTFATSDDHVETVSIVPNELTSCLDLESTTLSKEDDRQPCSICNDELSDHFHSNIADDGQFLDLKVPEGLKTPPLTDGLSKLHHELHEHFFNLFKNREALGLRVFLIEHEIEKNKFESAVSSVRDCLQRYSLTDRGWWWAARYLPLLVVASEEGYVYEGNGTDYWPRLERRLGVHFDHVSRRQLSKFFERSTNECGIAKPPDTPWHRQYCHIAWPITNAVLPLDMRIPFAEALKRLPCPIESYDDYRLMELLREVSVESGSIRYKNWLNSESIPAQIARFMLQDGYEANFLSKHTLHRIRTDLLAEETARRAIAEARTKQERKPLIGSTDSHGLTKSSNTATRKDQLASCPLSLRRTDEATFQLEVMLPSPPQACRSWLQHQLRTRKWEPTQWASPSALAIGISSLLFGVPCRIDIRSMLKRESGVRFLSGWESLNPDDELIDWLQHIDVSPVLPVVFRPDADLRSASHHLANYVSAGQPLWVLIRDTVQIPDCVIQLGKCGTLTVLEVDPSQEQAARWLGSQGINVGSRIQWRRSHDPSHSLMGRQVCTVGEFFAYELVALNGDSDVKIVCKTPNTAESTVAVDAEGIFGWSIDKSGEYEFSIWSADRLLDKTCFRAITESLRAAPNFQIDLLGGEATVTSLTQSQLRIEITARRDIRHAQVTVELGAAKVSIPAAEFPLCIATQDEVWGQLLTDQNRKAIAMGAELFLTVNVAGIESKVWRLENELTEVMWEVDSLGQVTATTDDREMAVVQLGLDKIPPSFTADPSLPSMSVVKQNERLCFELGTMVNSQKTSSLPTLPQLAGRVERRMVASQQGHVGLRELIELYIAVTTSRASHSVAALYQDKYKSTLKRCIHELILGTRWIERQERQESVFSNPLEVLVRCAIEREAGFNSMFHETVGVSSAWKRTASSEMVTAIPTHWWMLPLDAFNVNHAIGLDKAIANAYQSLACEIEDPIVRNLWENADLATDTERWKLVLSEASQLLHGAHLAEMVLPSELGEAIINEKLSGISVAEVSVLLLSWLKQYLRSHWSYSSWTPDRLEFALLLFERPQLLGRKDWTGATDLLLKDRFVARAIAFTSWRRARLEALGG